MNWNEDNFVETLTRYGEQEEDACPDGATICAVAGGAASTWLSHHFLKHVAACRECAELLRRINRLQSASVPEADFEWEQAEKRLHNWMAGFLEKNAQQRISQPMLTRASPSRTWPVWRWPLLAAGLAVLAASFACWFWLSYRPQKALPPEQATLRPAQPPPVSLSQNPNTGLGISPLAGNVPRPDTLKEQSAKGHAKKKAGPSFGTNDATNDGTNDGTNAVASSPAAEPANAPATSQPEPDKVAGATPSREIGTSATETGASPTAMAERHGPTTPAARGYSVQNRIPSFAPQGRARPASPSAGASVPMPSIVTLPGGTRLWIMLKSVEQKQDGSFVFDGALLMPVTQGRTVVLPGGVNVHGVGKVDQSQLTVQVTKLDNHGTAYRLDTSSQSGTEKSSAAGPAVRFDQGQVFEVWTSGTWTFVRASAEDTPK